MEKTIQLVNLGKRFSCKEIIKKEKKVVEKEFLPKAEKKPVVLQATKAYEETLKKYGIRSDKQEEEKNETKYVIKNHTVDVERTYLVIYDNITNRAICTIPEVKSIVSVSDRSFITISESKDNPKETLLSHFQVMGTRLENVNTFRNFSSVEYDSAKKFWVINFPNGDAVLYNAKTAQEYRASNHVPKCTQSVQFRLEPNEETEDDYIYLVLGIKKEEFEDVVTVAIDKDTFKSVRACSLKQPSIKEMDCKNDIDFIDKTYAAPLTAVNNLYKMVAEMPLQDQEIFLAKIHEDLKAVLQTRSYQQPIEENNITNDEILSSENIPNQYRSLKH